jgi:F0F1-type ATP synthase gamma subunit
VDSLKKTQTEILDLHSLRDLIGSYEEIASFRMKKVRDSVLYNRQYLDYISLIFDEVRSSYSRETKSILKRKSAASDKLTFLAHNGKKVSVFLSANTGLYGDIITKTFNKFTQEVRAGASELTIVGRHGLSLFLGSFPDTPYTFFSLPDHDLRPGDLSELIKHIVQYETIKVYYGKYISVVHQTASTVSISANIKPTTKTKSKKMYIFEPTLEDILMYFESEVFTSLFEQTVNESQLAKYASRVISMDRADMNIKKRLQRLEMEMLKLSHIIRNKKQLSTLSDIAALERRGYIIGN